jgi:hypothetical protein
MISVKKLLVLVATVSMLGMGTVFAADKDCKDKTCVEKTAVVAEKAPVHIKKLYDHSKHFGLGYQETFGSGAGFGTSLGEISLKYGITPVLTVQGLFGMDVTNRNGPKTYEVGGRLLANFLRHENSALYTGLGVEYFNSTAVDNMLRFNLPVGFEFNFEKLPEIAFSAETGLVYDYTIDKGISTVSTVGGNVGGSLGLGVHYWF